MIANRLPDSLPQQVYGARQVQKNEALVAAKQGVSMFSLMEKAGSAIFEQIKICYPKLNSLLIVCGKGNNGGDGYIVARLAQQDKISVTTLALTAKAAIKGDALTALKQLENVGGDVVFSQNENDLMMANKQIDEFEGDLIVDCLFGIGLTGQFSPALKTVVNKLNANNADILSVDVPSGLSAETGNVYGDHEDAIIAKQTVTFIALKKGLFTGQAANYIGELLFADLGLGELFRQQVSTVVYLQNKNNLPQLIERKPTSHKGNIGSILAIGGNQGMPGAIRLTAESALRSGTGLLSVCCHSSNQSIIFNGRPEMMFAPCDADKLVNFPAYNNAKVIVIGPGLGQDQWAQQLFHLVINEPHKKQPLVVIDADALHFLSVTPQHNDAWVLTPHPKEAASLLNSTVEQVELDRFSAVKSIAIKYGGICVLKGAGSLISDGHKVWINTSGNAGMATGGMGDVLSGIIAALLLQKSDLINKIESVNECHYDNQQSDIASLDLELDAVRLAVYIHGKAADNIASRNGQRGLLASDLMIEIQKLVNDL